MEEFLENATRELGSLIASQTSNAVPARDGQGVSFWYDSEGTIRADFFSYSDPAERQKLEDLAFGIYRNRKISTPFEVRFFATAEEVRLAIAADYTDREN